MTYREYIIDLKVTTNIRGNVGTKWWMFRNDLYRKLECVDSDTLTKIEDVFFDLDLSILIPYGTTSLAKRVEVCVWRKFNIISG